VRSIPTFRTSEVSVNVQLTVAGEHVRVDHHRVVEGDFFPHIGIAGDPGVCHRSLPVISMPAGSVSLRSPMRPLAKYAHIAAIGGRHDDLSRFALGQMVGVHSRSVHHDETVLQPVPTPSRTPRERTPASTKRAEPRRC